MIEKKRRRAAAAALALVAVAVAFSGCGDDKEKPEAYAAADPTRGTFCAALAKVDAPFDEAGQYATREQKVDAAKKVVDLLNDTAKAAPPEIQDAANTKLEAIRTAAEGEPSKLIDSATLDATEKLKAYCPA